MPSAEHVTSPIQFTFEYEGHGLALASISTGAITYTMRPSYALGDPLFALLQAVVELLRNGDDVTGCEWWYEPALDRWALRREGVRVHIAIRRTNHSTPSLSIWSPARFWLSEDGDLKFLATGDVWSFAAQVRRAVNRLQDGKRMTRHGRAQLPSIERSATSWTSRSTTSARI